MTQPMNPALSGQSPMGQNPSAQPASSPMPWSLIERDSRTAQPEAPDQRSSANMASSAAPQPTMSNRDHQANDPLDALAPQQAIELMLRDPVGFVRQIVASAAQTHLSDLKEEAEMRAAINAFRNANPDFMRFEPFIIQELVALLQTDPAAGLATWTELLTKASENFRQKFADAIKEQARPNADEKKQPPHMEGAGNRVMPEPPPAFTRDQIARMSLDEFLKSEAAINDALQNQRIR